MKSMKILRNTLCLLLIGVMLTGFRVFSKTTYWTATKASPKIFVKFCETPVVTNNDLPAGDPLYGQTITAASVMASIYADFTNITSAYVVLTDAATDVDYATSIDRTINVCFSSVSSGGGFASFKMKGSKAESCEITLDKKLTEKASAFVGVLSHEIGHCMGLDHPQESDRALMSYFKANDVVRLQMDDKMGIIQQFPDEPRFAEEAATFGASCAPKD